MSNIKLAIGAGILVIMAGFVWSYSSKTDKIKELNEIVLNQEKEITKYSKINKKNIENYENKIIDMKRQYEEIVKINKKQEERIATTKELEAKIDIKLKDKTVIQKNDILKTELNEIINQINGKTK